MDTTQITVDTAALLQKLGYAFSTKTTLIAELMQNCRRAGADRIEIQFSGDSGELVISDNGEGIQSFSKLLRLASSGWNQTTQSEEHPYGMGFFSALYAAEEVRVISNGKQIHFHTAKALAGEEIKIETVSCATTGTQIHLFGITLSEREVSSAINKYAKGFPIPVFFNCAEIARPHAPDSLTEGGLWKSSSIGNIFIQTQKFSRFNAADVYLQGLPIAKINRDSLDDKVCHVVHLDSKQFTARMPDREKLYDAANQEAIIKDVLLDTARAVLDAEAAVVLTADVLQQATWIDVRLSALQSIKAIDLLEQFDVLPGRFFQSCADNELGSRDSRYCPAYHQIVTRSEVESGKVMLCQGWPNGLCDTKEEESETFISAWAAAVFAADHGWLRLIDPVWGFNLTDNHWASQAAKQRDLDAINVVLDYVPYATGSFGGRFVSADLLLVENYRLTWNGSMIEVSDTCLAIGDDSYDCTFIVPRGANSDIALDMASDYQEDCTHHEDAYQEDCSMLSDLIGELNGRSAPDSVVSILERGQWDSATNLGNTRVGLFFKSSEEVGRSQPITRVIAFDMQALFDATAAVCENASPEAISLLRAEFQKIQ